VVSRLVRVPLGWTLTPVAAVRLVRADAHPVALFGTWAGGCDIIGSDPLLVRAASGELADVFDSGWPKGPVPDSEPDNEDAAFGGGWIGYLGYSAAGEALPPTGPRRLPAWWFGYYDHVLCHDRATGEWFFEALWTKDREAVLERRFEDLRHRASQAPATASQANGYTCGPFRLIPAARAHQAAVGQTVEYIRRGDIFQANICLRAEAEFTGDPLDAFTQAVTALDPPYAAFLDVPGGAVASMSPELFLRRTGHTVISRPIKGTTHRSEHPDQARTQRGDLEGSAKNRAENVMIVDLVRNDLSRVCEPGSVTAPRLLDTEPHPGVWHLVSEVRGTLADDRSDGDLIRASFPPGSVTGAPKVRALEVIDELETAPREVYTGAIGYRSPVAGLELNVAIRTFEFAAGRVWVGAGGGIVADSDPEAEYTECLHKAGPLIAAIGSRIDTGAQSPQPPATPRHSAGVFTSLLVTAGQTAGLDAHLARLQASTQRLYGKDLPDSLQAELEACLASRPTGRLRITVRPVGGPLQARVEAVPLTPAPQALTLRPVTVPGGFGAHKWQDRRLLADLAREAAGDATQRPDGQVLLTDLDGHLLETDRANVFAVIDGVLRTPPADSRILPGTTRQAILDAARDDGFAHSTDPLPLADLEAASEVFVTNAVYGVLPVHAVDGCPQSWDLGPVAKHFEMALASRPPDGVVQARRPSPEIGVRTLAARTTTARPVVILVDNYDSFTYNLAHLLVTAGCQVEVVRNDEVPAAQVTAAGAAAVVISPGPCAPPEAGISVDVVRGCARLNVPLLGICLGHQAIAAAFGASVIRAPRPVHGQVCAVRHDGRGVLAGLPQGFEATRYHSLIVDEHSLPPELMITARFGALPMGLRHAARQVEGVQFHPESILTAHGEAIVRNFVAAAVREESHRSVRKKN